MADHARILVASASAGTGHVRAGEALREALLARDPSSHVEHVDVLELGPSWLRRAYRDGFELMASRAPWLWKELYELTDLGRTDPARWGRPAKSLLFPELDRLLVGGGWDVVLATHFLPAQLAAGRPAPPVALVVTDFTLHRWWVQPRVERYFVATRNLADQVRHRVRGARADATGIPIAPSFMEALPRAAARASLGLDPDRPVALVMGGGMGIGVEASARAVAAADTPELQVLAVTGRNQRARESLQHDAGLPSHRLHVHGLVDRMPDFLAAADVVVTKPGGLTLSESLALGRPLVLTRGIPGHEDGNVEALTAAGAALHAPTDDKLTETIRRLSADPRLPNGLAAAARRIGRPHAASTVAGMVRREYVLDLVA